MTFWIKKEEKKGIPSPLHEECEAIKKLLNDHWKDTMGKAGVVSVTLEKSNTGQEWLVIEVIKSLSRNNLEGIDVRTKGEGYTPQAHEDYVIRSSTGLTKAFVVWRVDFLKKLKEHYEFEPPQQSTHHAR